MPHLGQAGQRFAKRSHRDAMLPCHLALGGQALAFDKKTSLDLARDKLGDLNIDRQRALFGEGGIAVRHVKLIHH